METILRRLTATQELNQRVLSVPQIRRNSSRHFIKREAVFWKFRKNETAICKSYVEATLLENVYEISQRFVRIMHGVHYTNQRNEKNFYDLRRKTNRHSAVNAEIYKIYDLHRRSDERDILEMCRRYSLGQFLATLFAITMRVQQNSIRQFL